MVPADDEAVATAAVHGQGIVAGLEDLAVLERDVMTADEPDARAAAFEPYPANDKVRAVDEFDVVVPVDLVCRAGEQRRLTFRGPDDDGSIRSPVGRNRPASVLRVFAAVQHQLIAGLQCIGHAFELLVGIDSCRMNLIGGRVAGMIAERHAAEADYGRHPSPQ